jgi:hypothetical protein
MTVMTYAPPECRACGCTDDVVCPSGCAWVDPILDPEPEAGDLCSACLATLVAAMPDPDGEEWRDEPLEGGAA